MLHLRVFIIIFSSSEKSTDKDLVNSILDVEDLVKFGNKQRWDLYIRVHLLVYLTDQSLYHSLLLDFLNLNPTKTREIFS